MLSPEQAELKKGLRQLSEQTKMPIHFIGDTVNTVLVGEEHWRFHIAQTKLAQWLKPSSILLESLGGFMYDPEISELILQERRTASEKEAELVSRNLTSDPEESLGGMLPFLRVSGHLKIPLMGCDLTMTEMLRIATNGYDESQINLLLAEENEREFLRITRERTKTLRDRYIAEYVRNHQGTLNKPVLAIVGWEHAKYIFDNQLLADLCFYEMVAKN